MIMVSIISSAVTSGVQVLMVQSTQPRLTRPTAMILRWSTRMPMRAARNIDAMMPIPRGAITQPAV